LRFTVRRPPTGEVSPCSHRPPGGDVTCSVHVGVAPPGSAGFALEHRLALAVSGCDVPTRGATLRRVRSRDLLDPAKSLVPQACDQQAPTASADRTVEPTFLRHPLAGLLDGAARGAGHRPHVESLDPDHVKPLRKVGGGVLDPVLPPIPLTGFQLRDRPFRLIAALGTALCAGESLLQHLQPLRLRHTKTWCVQQFAGRQCGRHGDTAVDADHAAVAWADDRVGNVGERDMPVASPITSNPVGLDPVRNRPRRTETHPPDLWHPHPTQAPVQPLDLMRLHPDLTKPFMHTGFTPRWLAMRAIEKELHRLREIPQRLLLHSLTSDPKPPIFGASLGQLPALLQVVWRLTAAPPVLLLLHRQIPHIPSIPAVRQQCLLLFRRRQQSKPQHIRTVTATTDIPGRGTRVSLGIGVLPGPKSKISTRRRLR
jgi:hypothetical protein